MGLKLDKIHVLIAEDHAHMRRMIKAILDSFGITHIREAPSGEDALRMMEIIVPDLLITDWDMRMMDGLELIRHIRTHPDSPNHYLPIIMITGFAARERVYRARDAGVNELLVKPITAKGMYSRLAAVVERPRDFVRTKTFFGPDRRRKVDPNFKGDDRRGKGAAPKVPVAPGAEMSQRQINKLFNP